jgi:hypothetical protein
LLPVCRDAEYVGSNLAGCGGCITVPSRPQGVYSIAWEWSATSLSLRPSPFLLNMHPTTKPGMDSPQVMSTVETCKLAQPQALLRSHPRQCRLLPLCKFPRPQSPSTPCEESILF